MKAIEKWDHRFILLARHVGSWSKDPSTRTGAVIVAPDRSVVSLGFNGFARGTCDDEELYADRELKYERIIHCEMNALLAANRGVKGCTLYTDPFLSCPRCAVHMVQAGIVRCVAPAVPKDKLDRWGEALERTKERFKEALVAWTEVNLEARVVTAEFSRLPLTQLQRSMLRVE